MRNMKRLGMMMLLTMAGLASADVIRDFETDLGGFYSNNSGLIEVSQSNEAAYGGNYSMKLNSPSGVSNWVEVISWFWSDWSEFPQLEMKFKAAQSGLGGWIHYSFWDWNQNGWANGGGAVASFAVPGDDAWHSITLYMSSFTRNSVGGIRFYTNELSAGAYYIDNISVVPEPATLGLLAVGGVMTLIRRKR